MEKNGKTAEELFQLGFCSEYPEEKIEYYSQLLEISSNDSVLFNQEAIALIWKNKGIAYCDLNQFDRAVDCFMQALEYDPENPDIWYNMGIAYFHLGDHKQALNSYDRALDINSGYERAWINKGLILESLSRHEEAIQCYERVNSINRLNPAYAIAWNNKGIAYCRLGK